LHFDQKHPIANATSASKQTVLSGPLVDNKNKLIVEPYYKFPSYYCRRLHTKKRIRPCATANRRIAATTRRVPYLAQLRLRATNYYLHSPVDRVSFSTAATFLSSSSYRAVTPHYFFLELRLQVTLKNNGSY